MLTVSRNLRPTVSRFLQDDWNSMFDWSHKKFGNGHSTLPSVNIKEESEGFLVEMAAPGMKKENFSISINNGVLSIKGESETESENSSDKNFTRREFSYQSFERTFQLDELVVDDDNIQAEYQDGVLLVNIPKKEEAKPKPVKMIEVS